MYGLASSHEPSMVCYIGFTSMTLEGIIALGSIIAVLQEYNFTKKEDNKGQFFCKLYRTKEGNWYDIEEAKIGTEKSILRMLKPAIDAKENDAILK